MMDMDCFIIKQTKIKNQKSLLMVFHLHDSQFKVGMNFKKTVKLPKYHRSPLVKATYLTYCLTRLFNTATEF